MESAKPTTTHEKALAINRDASRYGVFAEIGAGQEVSRWFFSVGGAAGTVAKSVSAYDMRVSDVTYGPAHRYVSRERLVAMLEHEHAQCVETLGPERADETSFFAFADTVEAASYRGSSECHGWLGMCFQVSPGAQHSQIVLHVRMRDAGNLQQQEALGIVGVNLIYGAFHYHETPEQLVKSLLDALSLERIEIDMIEFTGAAFSAVDNRVMSLRLVQYGLSPTALFDAAGTVLQPSEVLHKKPVLLQPGHFRPPTLICAELQADALAQFRRDEAVGEAPVASLLGLTLEDLSIAGEVHLRDYLDRIDALAAGEFTVLISSYRHYFRLAEYVSRYTSKPIGIALGVPNLGRIFDEQKQLEGGVLESLGRLFKHQVKLLVYPKLDPVTDELVTAENFRMNSVLDVLYRYLRDSGRIEAIETFNRQHLYIRAEDVRQKLSEGDPTWEDMVPARVAQAIKEKELFGYHAGT